VHGIKSAENVDWRGFRDNRVRPETDRASAPLYHNCNIERRSHRRQILRGMM